MGAADPGALLAPIQAALGCESDAHVLPPVVEAIGVPRQALAALAHLPASALGQAPESGASSTKGEVHGDELDCALVERGSASCCSYTGGQNPD